MASTPIQPLPDEAPFHFLMSPPPSDSPLNKRRIADPRLEGDYLAKRHQVFQSKDFTLWSGATKLERDLVQCCETPKDDNEEDLPTEGGALDRQKEIRFVGLLARECHTMASRSLALAILERTLEVYVKERGEDSSSNEEESQSSEEEIEGVASDDEQDDDYQPGSSSRKRNASNSNTGDNNNNNNGHTTKKTKTDEDDDSESDEDPDRFDNFLGAGGLKILNRWLIEASTSITTPTPKPPPGSSSSNNSRNNNARLPVPVPATRPLIFPILSILEHIPFDKKLVMDSKINKQVRKLSKQVDGILDARAKGKHQKEDLENWTLSGNGTDALDEIKEAIDGVKSTWEESAKRQYERIPDPFGSLKAKMRERLHTLTDFEAGRIDKPDWIEEQEDKKEAQKKKPAANSVQIMAAKERRLEREDHEKRLHAAQQEHRENLAKIREIMRRRREETAPALRAKKGDVKAVSWKDGFTTTDNRNRTLLEEVFVFTEGSTATNAIKTEDEESEGTSDTAQTKSDDDDSPGSDDMERHNLL
jgi:hypothetical protein